MSFLFLFFSLSRLKLSTAKNGKIASLDFSKGSDRGFFTFLDRSNEAFKFYFFPQNLPGKLY